jgi:hypothetical protein
MARITRKLVVVVLILVGAGMASAATSPFIMGPSAGISSSSSPLTQVSPSTSTTPSTSGGVTTSTTGNTTTVTGSGTTPTPGTTTPSTSVPGASVGIEQIVAVTRTVEAGAPVSAFAVPAGNRLVITDVVITNTGTAPVCGAGIAGSATTATPTATGATTTTGATTSTTTGTTTGAATGGVTVSAATDTAGTGVLCVPAQTSLTLALTTGLEFASGQSVMLSNQTTAGGTTTSGGRLFYHLRGFLISGV